MNMDPAHHVTHASSNTQQCSRSYRGKPTHSAHFHLLSVLCRCQSTTFCPYCSIHLSYPTGSALIQCPQCQVNPQPPPLLHPPPSAAHPLTDSLACSACMVVRQPSIPTFHSRLAASTARHYSPTRPTRCSSNAPNASPNTPHAF